MDPLMALAVSIGVLIALWVKFGGLLIPSLAIAVPAGIVAWACFFAAGGKLPGLQKAIAATLSGVIWVWIATALIGATGLGNLAFLFIGIVAFLIVLQSKIRLLSFIPGGFCGAAITAASGATVAKGYLAVAVSLVAGAVLGYASEVGAGVLTKKPSA
jgi:hypothetical protein